MTRSMDDLLRETIRDLAAESAAAPGLAGGALARGRRLRRRRRLTTVAAVLLLVGAATIPFAILHLDRHLTRPAPVATVPVPTTVPASRFSMNEPFRVPGGLVVTSIGRYEGGREMVQNYVLDRATGRYRTLPTKFLDNSPSPDGRYTIGSYLGRQELALREIATGVTRWVPFETAGAQWSSSGDRLVTSRNVGFTVVDPATGHGTDFDIPADQQLCADDCQYTWLGGDTELARPQVFGFNADPGHVTGLAIFDARTGKLLRTLPVLGAPLGGNPWSADDRTVLVRPSVTGTNQVIIANAADGRSTGDFTATTAFFLPDGTIFGRLGAVVTHYDAAGHPLESVKLPQPLAQKELTFGRS